MDLPTFDVDRPQTFKTWIDSFEWMFLNKWHDINMTYDKDDRELIESENGQRYLYRHFYQLIGPKGREFLSSQVISKLPAGDQQKFKAIKNYLLDNCQPKKNDIKTIGDLITCEQKDDETLGEFTNRARNYAQRISTTDNELLEKITLTAILYGLKDKDKVNKILMSDKMPNLDEAIRMLKTQEAIWDTSRVKVKSENNVDRVSHRYNKIGNHP